MKPLRSGWSIWPPVIIIRYWIVQGMLFMNYAEIIYRLTVEFLFFCTVYMLCYMQNIPINVIYIVIIAHTFSFIFNGHLFAMLTHDLFWFGLYKDKKKFYTYIDQMRIRLNKKNPEYTAGVVFFGSLARGIFRETSDLDVRFIAKPGFWNAIKTSNLVFIERIRALFAGFPIDAYMFRSASEIKRKMDVENEHPVCMYSSGNILKNNFPEMQKYKFFEKKFLSTMEHFYV